MEGVLSLFSPQQFQFVNSPELVNTAPAHYATTAVKPKHHSQRR